MRERSTQVRLLLFAVVVVSAAGCGSGSAASKPAGALPDGAAVAVAARPMLTPFALSVQRSAVGERPGAIGGSELSLYVQPAQAQSAVVYAGRFTPLAAAVIPKLFAQYPAIDWIDLCQEPAKSSGTWETVPVTRLEVSREGSGRVDWQHTDLATLLALIRTRPLEFSLEWHNAIGETPVWRAAAARALTLSP